MPACVSRRQVARDPILSSACRRLASGRDHDETCSDVVANEIIPNGDVLLGEIVIPRIICQFDGALIIDLQHDQSCADA